MNHKLITELAIKSYIVVGDYSYCRSEISPEKFTRLIIEECSSLTLDYKNDEHYAGWIEYRELIKQHFGIEE